MTKPEINGTGYGQVRNNVDTNSSADSSSALTFRLTQQEGECKKEPDTVPDKVWNNGSDTSFQIISSDGVLFEIPSYILLSAR